MPSYFQSNLATHVDTLFREQLVDVIGPRAGDWVITLTDRPEASAWDVSIDGPNAFEWGKRFDGVERQVERQIETVVQAIRTAIALPEADLTTALAELAKGGIAFTTETEDDKTVYIIDRIGLREGELIHLKNSGALTPEGIRQYLVDRAA